MIYYNSKTALVVVDMQNDFASPGRSMDRSQHGSLYVQGGETIIEGINEEIIAAKQDFSPVIYTRDWHPPITPHFAKDGGPWPTHCVAGTWGAEYVDGLIGPNRSSFEVLKGPGHEHGYSAFDTPVADPITLELTYWGLNDELVRLGIHHIVIVGLATDYCVGQTAIAGANHGYGVVVVENLVKAVNLEAGDGDRMKASIESAGGIFL